MHPYIHRPANPGYTAEELAHQLSATKAVLLIIHPAFLKTAKSAMQQAGTPQDRIVFMESPPSQASFRPYSTIDELVHFGMQNPPNFNEIHLKAGQAKKTLAFLSFSSGTTGTSYVLSFVRLIDIIITGKPKVSHFRHYNFVAPTF